MSFEEDYRVPYKAKCACGEGFLRYYLIVCSNDWNDIREKKTDIEFHCAQCEKNYYYRKIAWEELLIPNELTLPKEPKRLDRKYSYSKDEIFVSNKSIQDIKDMISDMTDHRFIPRLTNNNALEFAQEWVFWTKKKSLKPMIDRLKNILENYNSLINSYNEKKPYIEKQRKVEEEYSKKLDEVLESSYKLKFEEDIEEIEREKKEREQEKEKHKYDSFIANVNYDKTYAKDLSGLWWDTLYIEKCINDEYFQLNKPEYQQASILIQKKYSCICSLCGKNLEVCSSNFEIKMDERGYYPLIKCDCHSISSFEAKTMDILNNLGIKYNREVIFEDLKGDYDKPLRFDFGLYKELYEGKPKYDLMIELQGPHHFKEGYYDEFGEFIENTEKVSGNKLNRQMKYDERKKEYCADHSINLECIKYSVGNEYERLEKRIISILKQYGYNYYTQKEIF